MDLSRSRVFGFVLVALLGSCGRLGYDLLPEQAGGPDGGTGASASQDASLIGDATIIDSGAGGAPASDATLSDAAVDSGMDASLDAGFDAGDASHGGATDAGSDGGFTCVPSPFVSSAWYASSFDEGINIWTPGTDGSPAGWVDRSPGDWGGVYDQWLSPITGNCDRALSLYRSTNTSDVHWRLSLPNDTGQRIVGLDLRYDVELQWSRLQGADSLSADYAFRVERLAWFLPGDAYADAVSPAISNATVDGALLQRWLSDAEMDAASLSVRSVSTQILGLDVAPGANVRIRMGFEMFGTAIDERNMNLGLDNLEINPIHP